MEISPKMNLATRHRIMIIVCFIVDKDILKPLLSVITNITSKPLMLYMITYKKSQFPLDSGSCPEWLLIVPDFHSVNAYMIGSWS